MPNKNDIVTIEITDITLYVNLFAKAIPLFGMARLAKHVRREHSGMKQVVTALLLFVKVLYMNVMTMPIVMQVNIVILHVTLIHVRTIQL